MIQQENTIIFQFNINLPHKDQQNMEQYYIQFAFDENNLAQALKKIQNKINDQYKFFIEVDFEYEYVFLPYDHKQKIMIINLEDNEKQLQNSFLKKKIFTLQNEIENQQMIKYLQFFENTYSFAIGSILNFTIKGELIIDDQKINPKQVILSELIKQYIKNKFCTNEENEEKKFDLTQDLRKYCGQLKSVRVQLSYPKIFSRNIENKVKNIIISSSGVEIKNIFAYLCYQFVVITNGVYASPLKVLKYEKLQISDQGKNIYNDISFQITNEQIPAIFENENSSFSCKHFLIINISFHRQYCFSQPNDLDFIIPIVIQQGNLQPDQPEFLNSNTYKYLEKPEISIGEIKFQLDSNTQRYEYSGQHLLK